MTSKCVEPSVWTSFGCGVALRCRLRGGCVCASAIARGLSVYLYTCDARRTRPRIPPPQIFSFGGLKEKETNESGEERERETLHDEQLRVPHHDDAAVVFLSQSINTRYLMQYHQPRYSFKLQKYIPNFYNYNSDNNNTKIKINN